MAVANDAARPFSDPPLHHRASAATALNGLKNASLSVLTKLLQYSWLLATLDEAHAPTQRGAHQRHNVPSPANLFYQLRSLAEAWLPRLNVDRGCTFDPECVRACQRAHTSARAGAPST